MIGVRSCIGRSRTLGGNHPPRPPRAKSSDRGLSEVPTLREPPVYTVVYTVTFFHFPLRNSRPDATAMVAREMVMAVKTPSGPQPSV